METVLSFGELAVRQQPLLRRGAGSADRLRARLNANREQPQLRVGAAGRDGVDEIALQHRRTLGVRDVDQRRIAGHRHRFLDGANPQVGVHRRGEIRRQVDRVANERGEALKRERDLIKAGTKIDDRVSALIVGDDRARPLDQRRARCLHRDSRQHRAARIPDVACNRALGRCRRRDQHREAPHPKQKSQSTHRRLLLVNAAGFREIGSHTPGRPIICQLANWPIGELAN